MTASLQNSAASIFIDTPEGWITDITTILTKHRDDFQEVITDLFKPEGYLLLKKLIETYIYWSNKGKLISIPGKGEGLFYITVSQIKKKIGLSGYKQRKYLKILKKSAVLKTIRVGNDGKRHVLLFMNQIISLFNITFVNKNSRDNLLNRSACIDYVGLGNLENNFGSSGKIIHVFSKENFLKNSKFLQPKKSEISHPVVKNEIISPTSSHIISNKTIKKERREEEKEVKPFSHPPAIPISISLNINDLPPKKMKDLSDLEIFNIKITEEDEQWLEKKFKKQKLIELEKKYGIMVANFAYSKLSEWKNMNPTKVKEADSDMDALTRWAYKAGINAFLDEVREEQRIDTCIDISNKNYKSSNTENDPQKQVYLDRAKQVSDYHAVYSPIFTSKGINFRIENLEHNAYFFFGHDKIFVTDISFNEVITCCIRKLGFDVKEFESYHPKAKNSNRTMVVSA